MIVDDTYTRVLSFHALFRYYRACSANRRVILWSTQF